MKTDEQLEQKISEEFEKKWKEVPQPLSGNKKGYKKGFKDGHKAAALPLMKKIEELEKKKEQLKRFWEPVLAKFDSNKYAMAHNKIAIDSLTEAFDIFCDNEKLQKENEELRRHLMWAINMTVKFSPYKGDIEYGKRLIAMFNLDKEGGEVSDVNRECQECGGYEMNDGVSELCLCHDDEDDLVYIESLEIKIKELEQRLKEAEEVIGFYADKANWHMGDSCYADNFKFRDCEPVYGDEEAAGICGKRARAYLAKYVEKEEGK